MTKERIFELVRELFEEAENTVHLPEENVDVPVLEKPLVGFADADDPIFAEYKKPEVIGEEWMAPKEWLESAKTVIAFFFPYSEDIRSRARKSKELVNEAWANGYPAGSRLAGTLIARLAEKLEEEGVKVVNPGKDPRMKVTNTKIMSGPDEDLHFCPSWSTRHAAFAAGLGTFGMHRHMITESGACGTLGSSLIIDLELEPTRRKYTDVYENCIKCGACARRCPAGAITMEYQRNLLKCSRHGGYLREKFGGGGCGKCMVGTPCEHRNPAARLKK